MLLRDSIGTTARWPSTLHGLLQKGWWAPPHQHVCWQQPVPEAYNTILVHKLGMEIVGPASVGKWWAHNLMWVSTMTKVHLHPIEGSPSKECEIGKYFACTYGDEMVNLTNTVYDTSEEEGHVLSSILNLYSPAWWYHWPNREVCVHTCYVYGKCRKIQNINCRQNMDGFQQN